MTNDFQIKNLEKYAIVPVFPNSKRPATHHGYKDGIVGLDISRILSMGYNLGLSLSLSRLVCIDIDMHGYSDGLANFAKLEKELGALPNSYTERTATGNGLHKLFLDTGLINPKGEICSGVEIKYKGIIVCSPSIINGVRYEIIDGIDGQGNWILPPLPQKWLDVINRPERNYSTNTQVRNPVKAKQYKNADVKRILTNCNFIKYCADEDNASSLEYPMWFSAISTLAQIENSDEFIHSISEPHPKYTYNETQKMIDQARSFGHPHTCAYISGNHPEICGNCQSAVKLERGNYGK